MKFIKKIFKKKIKIKDDGKDNNLSINLKQQNRHSSAKISVSGSGNEVTLCGNLSKKTTVINISVIGNNNKVIINNVSEINGEFSLRIYGNNCEFVINGEFCCNQFYAIIGHNHFCFGVCNNSKIIIGNKVSVENAAFTIFNSNTSISIGDGCMISYGVNFYHTDAHPVYDLNSKKVINKVGQMQIGNNCWIGANATILKNVKLEPWTIVGYASVVAKSFDKPNIAIAGNPAKIVKENVYWNNNGSLDYIPNIEE